MQRYSLRTWLSKMQKWWRVKVTDPNRTKVSIVDEPEFVARLRLVLKSARIENVGAVTGPGRSGAVAAVYASHMLGIPFIPYGARCPDQFQLLIVDTARESGRTRRLQNATTTPTLWLSSHSRNRRGSPSGTRRRSPSGTGMKHR
jgi:hypothetical protein